MLLLLMLRAANKPHGQSSSRGRSGSSRPQDNLLLLLEAGTPQARRLSSASSSLLRPQSHCLLQSPRGLVQQSVRRLLPRYSFSQKSNAFRGASLFGSCKLCRPRSWPQSRNSLLLCWRWRQGLYCGGRGCKGGYADAQVMSSNICDHCAPVGAPMCSVLQHWVPSVPQSNDPLIRLHACLPHRPTIQEYGGCRCKPCQPCLCSRRPAYGLLRSTGSRRWAPSRRGRGTKSPLRRASTLLGLTSRRTMLRLSSRARPASTSAGRKLMPPSQGWTRRSPSWQVRTEAGLLRLRAATSGKPTNLPFGNFSWQPNRCCIEG